MGVGDLNFQSSSSGEGNIIRAATSSIVLKAEGFGNVGMRGQVYVDNLHFTGGTVAATSDSYENIVLKPYGDGTVQSPFNSQFGNLLFSGNTISETTTDGDILLTPNGDGKVVVPHLTGVSVTATKLSL